MYRLVMDAGNNPVIIILPPNNRPVLAAIKNHKQDPYFLGTAVKTIASLAQSGIVLWKFNRSSFCNILRPAFSVV